LIAGEISPYPTNHTFRKSALKTSIKPSKEMETIMFNENDYHAFQYPHASYYSEGISDIAKLLYSQYPASHQEHTQRAYIYITSAIHVIRERYCRLGDSLGCIYRDYVAKMADKCIYQTPDYVIYADPSDVSMRFTFPSPVNYYTISTYMTDMMLTLGSMLNTALYNNRDMSDAMFRYCANSPNISLIHEYVKYIRRITEICGTNEELDKYITTLTTALDDFSLAISTALQTSKY
jgi:hypothetical protein